MKWYSGLEETSKNFYESRHFWRSFFTKNQILSITDLSHGRRKQNMTKIINATSCWLACFLITGFPGEKTQISTDQLPWNDDQRFSFIFSKNWVVDASRSCRNGKLDVFAEFCVSSFCADIDAVHQLGHSPAPLLRFRPADPHDVYHKEVLFRDVFQGKFSTFIFLHFTNMSLTGKLFPRPSILSVQQLGTHDNRLKRRRKCVSEFNQRQRWKHILSTFVE